MMLPGSTPGGGCLFGTGNTLGVLAFVSASGNATVPDPGTMCVKIRDSVEVPAGG
jgi:hypothetical protein